MAGDAQRLCSSSVLEFLQRRRKAPLKVTSVMAVLSEPEEKCSAGISGTNTQWRIYKRMAKAEDGRVERWSWGVQKDRERRGRESGGRANEERDR